jgi:hypothetical protein
MTVPIYVDTSKQVGDRNHLKVFANADAAEAWFAENDPEGAAFKIRDSGMKEAANPPVSEKNEKPGNRPGDRSNHRC